MLALQHGVDLDDPASWPAIFLAGLDEPEEHEGDENSEDDNSEPPTKVTAVEPDSDSDLEPERSLDLPFSFPVLPIQNFQRPHATGPNRPPYELLDSLPFEQGRNILQFVDYVYPRHKNLKGGITVYLLAVDYKTDFVMFRARSAKMTLWLLSSRLSLSAAGTSSSTRHTWCPTGSPSFTQRLQLPAVEWASRTLRLSRTSLSRIALEVI